MNLEVASNWTAYPCTKGCKKIFSSDYARKRHENYFDCPHVSFETPSSPLIYCTDEMENNRNFGLMNWNGVMQDVGQEVEIETDYIQLSNMQQINCDSRSLQEIMTTQNPSGYQSYEQGNSIDDKKTLKNSRNNMQPDLRTMFSDAFPEVIHVGERKSSIAREMGPEKTLSELNSEDSRGSIFYIEDKISTSVFETLCQSFKSIPEETLFRSFPDLNMELPIQDPDISGSQDLLEGMEDPKDMYTCIPIGTDCEQAMDQIMKSLPDDLLNFLDEGNGANPVPGAAVSAESTPVPIVPQEPPKRGRGRPRKEKPVSMVKPYQIVPTYSQINPHTSDEVLSSRRSKIASLQKIRSSIFGGSESGASDQESDPLGAEGSRKRARRGPRVVVEDPDYEDATTQSSESSEASPNTKVYKVLPEVRPKEDLERRRKNNQSSGRSRQKRKMLNEMAEQEREELEARFKQLSGTASTLQEAVETLRSLMLRCVAENNKAT